MFNVEYFTTTLPQAILVNRCLIPSHLCVFSFVYLCICVFVFLCICVTHAIVANGCLIPSHLLFYLRILQLPSDGETLSDGIEGGGGGVLWQTEG